MKIRILLFAMLALAVAGGAYAHRGGGCPGQRGHAAKDCSSPKECLDQARCGGGKMDTAAITRASWLT